MVRTPLRDGLNNLAIGYRLTVWIDRRIDPTHSVTLRLGRGDALSLGDAFHTIATLIDADVGLIENVVYFGPKGAVARIQRAAVELHDTLSQAGARSEAQMRPLSWEELTTPSELAELIAANWSRAAELRLPHDLMHAGELLEPCTLATQLSILCGGFGLEPFVAGDGSISSRDLGPETTWRSNYPASRWSPSQINQVKINQVKREYPGSFAARRSGVWEVVGATDFHVALLSLGAGTNSAAKGVTRLSGRLAGVASKLIADFAESQQLQVVWDARCTAAQQAQFVSFEVSDATLEEIVQAYARAAGLTVQLIDGTLHITP